MLISALSTLTYPNLMITVGALLLAFTFEFVNGFHDTANAVATVIYTRSLRPTPAVVWSALWNMIGIFAGGIGVAYAIVHLLPVEILVGAQSHAGILMILSLLASAILWNLGTWYYGLPASSSHALIGSILGIGLSNALLQGKPILSGINLHKLSEVGLSLLLSPVLGYVLAAALLLFSKRLIPDRRLHQPPALAGMPPPWWIRGILVTTCTGVSFAHGSNDGQKGMGLVMLILIGMMPGEFALNREASTAVLQQSLATISATLGPLGSAPVSAYDWSMISNQVRSVETALEGKAKVSQLSAGTSWAVRVSLLKVDSWLQKIVVQDRYRSSAELRSAQVGVKSLIEYVPLWVILAIAISLGFGTTIGWQRIVVTVGEKIGKSHLTYSQGACAELVAMGTIGLASFSGLPVSTTHVLSSGVAGTMWANQSGLNGAMVKQIAAAWVLTLPVTMLISSVLFALGKTFWV